MPAFDDRDPRDDARSRHVVVAVHAVGGERADFQEGRDGIGETIDALASGQFAACPVSGRGFFATTQSRSRQALAQLVDRSAHRRGIFGKLRDVRIDARFELPHPGAFSILTDRSAIPRRGCLRRQHEVSFARLTLRTIEATTKALSRSAVYFYLRVAESFGVLTLPALIEAKRASGREEDRLHLTEREAIAETETDDGPGESLSSG